MDRLLIQQQGHIPAESSHAQLYSCMTNICSRMLDMSHPAFRLESSITQIINVISLHDIMGFCIHMH